MKLLLSFLLLVICSKQGCLNQYVECQNNTTLVLAKDTQEIETTKKMTYVAVARGFYLRVVIGNDSIVLSNNRQMDSEKVYPIPEGEKQMLIKLINDINIKSLPHLQAPSTRHQIDGVAIATLQVTIANNSYKTVAFDHGNPPGPIKPIVEKMLSIKSMIEKQ